jgi:hypothetical protein
MFNFKNTIPFFLNKNKSSIPHKYQNLARDLACMRGIFSCLNVTLYCGLTKKISAVRKNLGKQMIKKLTLLLQTSFLRLRFDFRNHLVLLGKILFPRFSTCLHPAASAVFMHAISTNATATSAKYQGF